MELQIDKRELERLKEKLEGAPEAIRDAKRQTFEAAAPKLKAALDEQIPYGEKGKVQGWQWGVVGSKGGYAAVRPKAKTFTEPTKRKGNTYAVGRVTNAIDSGHKFPRPSGTYKYYKPRIESGGMMVKGQNYYQDAEARVAQAAQEAAQELLDAVKHQLE